MRFRDLLSRSVGYWRYSGATLGGSFGALVLALWVIADELEMFGLRYGSPDFDLASLVVLFILCAVAAFIGSATGGVADLVLGFANAVVLWRIQHMHPLSKPVRWSPRAAGLISAAMSLLLVPPMLQLLTNWLLPIRNTIGPVPWLDPLLLGAEVVAAAASWWITGHVAVTENLRGD